MARYVKDLVLNKPEDFVTFIMNDYLQKNQFVVSEWKGEPAYRTGDALIEGYKYLKWSYENGTLHLEAWMKSTFGKEMGLDGFVGALQKKPYRQSTDWSISASYLPPSAFESSSATPISAKIRSPQRVSSGISIQWFFCSGFIRAIFSYLVKRKPPFVYRISTFHMKLDININIFIVAYQA